MRTWLGNFDKAPRHTMQCEFDPYVADLEKELAHGRRRSKKRGKLTHTIQAGVNSMCSACNERSKKCG